MRLSENWQCGHWLVAMVAGFGVFLGCGGTDHSSGPPLVPITTCSETFTACGGDPTGTWKFVSGCVDGDVVASLNQAMATDHPECVDIFTEATIAVALTVTMGSGTYSQTETSTMNYRMSMTPACFVAISNGVALNASTCSQYQTGLNQEAGTSGTCSFVGTNCDCSFAVSSQNDETGTYSVNGTTVTSTTVDAGVSETTTAEFCVQGDTLTTLGSSSEGPSSISHYARQ